MLRGEIGIMGWATYINVILKFNTARTVQLDAFQSLADHIIWLTLRLLGSLDSFGFVEVAAIVNVQLAECILEGENITLI